MFEPKAVGQVVVRHAFPCTLYEGVLYATAIIEGIVPEGMKLYTQADIDQLIHERDNYRAVLEGAEYRNLDNIGSGPRRQADELGRVMAKMSKAVIQSAGEAGQRAILNARLEFERELLDEQE